MVFILNNNTFCIKKIFRISGKHQIFLNQNQITNQELKEVTENYIDMHGQYSQHSILNKNNHIHWGLEDPAEARGSDEEIMNVYRKVRDKINENIDRLL